MVVTTELKEPTTEHSHQCTMMCQWYRLPWQYDWVCHLLLCCCFRMLTIGRYCMGSMWRILLLWVWWLVVLDWASRHCLWSSCWWVWVHDACLRSRIFPEPRGLRLSQMHATMTLSARTHCAFHCYWFQKLLLLHNHLSNLVSYACSKQ